MERSQEVLSRHRPAAGVGEVTPRVFLQLLVQLEPELAAVEARLLEVIAKDLVQLDELEAVFPDPAGETLV